MIVSPAMANTLRSYSAYWGQPSGSSGSGLDQVIGWIARDPGLAGNTEASAIAAGIQAANGLNELIVTGLKATGSFNDVMLDADDIRRLNEWLRSDAARKNNFEILHGDDENGVATGFHNIQNDGANQTFRGLNLVDTVLDGIYHFGFEINANNQFLNEDGNANAAIADVASWLTALKTDYATTNTNLDRTTELIIADKGLAANISWADIAGGATAANNLNGLILEGINALNTSGQADSDATRLSSSEVRWINQWIKADQNRNNFFITNHGDDENGSETGFHLVQNDGASSVFFGRNLVNTVLDGIYHIGFNITSDDRFQNEDGDANAKVSDVADWLTYFYSDQSTTGTGLDRIVDTIKIDRGLSRNTSAADINGGAEAANNLNKLILRALNGTGVYADQWLTRSDLRKINQWIKTYEYPLFVQLHGDDENGEETGFHLVQNDGAETQYFGKNLVNTVADGIFHVGFQIDGENFQNEDGDTNASLSDVSAWLNYFLGTRRVTFGTWDADTFIGNQESEQVVAYGGNDSINGGGGDDLLDGGWGNDTILGGAGNDILDGAFDNDVLDGGENSDTYLVSGTQNGGWSSFNGFDTYANKMEKSEIIKRAQGFCAPFRINEGKNFRIKDVDPADTLQLDPANKQAAEAVLKEGVEVLSELQDMLYAQDRWGVLLLFQAMDAAGKDSTIKHVMSGVNPQGCQVTSFKAPSAEDLDHDYLWRCQRHLPERGRIGIFNRSYYEETLVVRVHPELLARQSLPPRLVGPQIWRERFRDIRHFETYLGCNGIVVRKFFLHVSRQEQKKRFLKRLDQPEKHWKFSAADVRERGHWNAYMNAYEEMIQNTASEEAPWYVVPADNKWFTRLVVAAAVIDTLLSLDLQYPKLSEETRKELEAARRELEAEA